MRSIYTKCYHEAVDKVNFSTSYSHSKLNNFFGNFGTVFSAS